MLAPTFIEFKPELRNALLIRTMELEAAYNRSVGDNSDGQETAREHYEEAVENFLTDLDYEPKVIYSPFEVVEAILVIAKKYSQDGPEGNLVDTSQAELDARVRAFEDVLFVLNDQSATESALMAAAQLREAQ
jgi:hypothetical protein